MCSAACTYAVDLLSVVPTRVSLLLCAVLRYFEIKNAGFALTVNLWATWEFKWLNDEILKCGTVSGHSCKEIKWFG